MVAATRMVLVQFRYRDLSGRTVCFSALLAFSALRDGSLRGPLGPTGSADSDWSGGSLAFVHNCVWTAAPVFLDLVLLDRVPEKETPGYGLTSHMSDF